MRTILRAGLGALLGLVLAYGPVQAIEYDDIFELTDKGVSEETMVQLIVDDGRAFELSDDELDDLRDAGVSEIVIDAMLDPAVGRAWLAGESVYDSDTYRPNDGYATSLDAAYGQGYAEGRSTALVYSFGYYYGPLSRYYYNDPFYYPFWSSGYGYSYWPSYYAYWYRPAFSWSYAYPYNWYAYSSYYCYTYYDPGYWVDQGYRVQPGYGRTVWDGGPRWRDGGITPPKGGRPDAVIGGPTSRVVSGRLADNTGRRLRNPSGPPAIREAIAERTGDRRVGDRTASPRPAVMRKPVDRAPLARSPETRAGVGVGRRGTVERGTVERGTVERGDRSARGDGGRAVSRGREAPPAARVIRSAREGAGREAREVRQAPRRAASEEPRAEARGQVRREAPAKAKADPAPPHREEKARDKAPARNDDAKSDGDDRPARRGRGGR